MTKDNHTALCVFILIMCCLCKSSVHWYCSCTTYCACFSVLVTFVTYFSSELPPNYSHLFFSFLFPFILHRTILCSLLVLCVTIPSKDINSVLCAWRITDTRPGGQICSLLQAIDFHTLGRVPDGHACPSPWQTDPVHAGSYLWGSTNSHHRPF